MTVCCLMATHEFFSYIVARPSFVLLIGNSTIHRTGHEHLSHYTTEAVLITILTNIVVDENKKRRCISYNSTSFSLSTNTSIMKHLACAYGVPLRPYAKKK